MSGPLTGTAALARFALRRDRVMIPAWIYLVLIGVGETAYVFTRLYQTQSARAGLAASGEGDPALLFLYGRLNGTSIGALTAWRYGVWAALFAVLMTIFIVTRHTRADEETGRLELIGSARVGGRHRWRPRSPSRWRATWCLPRCCAWPCRSSGCRRQARPRSRWRSAPAVSPSPASAR